MLAQWTALPNIGKGIVRDLLAVQHFTETAESLPWWKFAMKGKADLALNARSKS